MAKITAKKKKITKLSDKDMAEAKGGTNRIANTRGDTDYDETTKKYDKLDVDSKDKLGKTHNRI